MKISGPRKYSAVNFLHDTEHNRSWEKTYTSKTGLSEQKKDVSNGRTCVSARVSLQMMTGSKRLATAIVCAPTSVVCILMCCTIIAVSAYTINSKYPVT